MSTPPFERSYTTSPPLRVPSTSCLTESYTALSTLFMADVITVSGANELWSVSTPMADILFSWQAWITPTPVPPAAWKITSAPLVIIVVALVLPIAGSAKLFASIC